MAQAQFVAFASGAGDGGGDFAYGLPAHGTAGMPMALSVYADRVHLRDQIGEDAVAAGFRVTGGGAVSALLEGGERPLGEVVVLDCPAVDGRTLAALARLDIRAAHTGAALVVSTSMAALDDVFACLDQSNPQILVNPCRAERLIALGEVHVRRAVSHVRELSDEDRLVLLRLTAQVSQIAARLDRLAPVEGARVGDAHPDGAARVETPRPLFFGAPDAGDTLVRSGTARLPDAKLVRRIIRQRQMRAQFFDGDLFADPAWDMLLDLTAARAEARRVSVTSLCIASNVPPTTALRWIGQLTEAGLVQRVEDKTDRRRAFITLTDRAAEAMARFFAKLGRGASGLL